MGKLPILHKGRITPRAGVGMFVGTDIGQDLPAALAFVAGSKINLYHHLMGWKQINIRNLNLTIL